MWDSIIIVGVGVLIAAIAIWVHVVSLRKEAMAKQYKVPKKYTLANLGIPNALVEEMQEYERFCKERGIDPRPLPPEEVEKQTERIVASLSAHWVRQTNLRDLTEDVVIQSYTLAYGEKITLEDGREAVKIGSYGTTNDSDGYDPSRSDALFVIEEYKIEKRFYRPWTKIRILLRRLNTDETYDPNGELLFVEEALSEHPRKAEPVGQMNYDRTALTRTLLRR